MLDDSVIRQITSWGGAGVATSLYLDVDGSRHPRWPEVERRADHLFRSARQHARQAASGAEAEVEADLAEIRTWLDRRFDRTAIRGVALFSCAGQDLFEAVELTVPVRDQVVVDPEPDVAQLCTVLATSWSAVAVAVDKERWRVLRLRSDGEIRELDVLDDTKPRNVDIDIELAGFGRHEEELAREHLRRVARTIVAEVDRHPATYLVPFGPQESVAQLDHYLPRRVGARSTGARALPPGDGTIELARAAAQAIEHAEEGRRAAVLAEVRGRLVTGTSVVTGLEATLGALGAEQVATLLAERTFEASGGRCDGCRLLVAREGPCPRCGGHVRPSDNVVDAAIADAFLHGVALEPVADGALGDVGRMAALTHRWHGMTSVERSDA